MQWEYKIHVLPTKASITHIQYMLDNFGSMGWELTELDFADDQMSTAYILKRPVEDRAEIIKLPAGPVDAAILEGIRKKVEEHERPAHVLTDAEVDRYSVEAQDVPWGRHVYTRSAVEQILRSRMDAEREERQHLAEEGKD